MRTCGAIALVATSPQRWTETGPVSDKLCRNLPSFEKHGPKPVQRRTGFSFGKIGPTLVQRRNRSSFSKLGLKRLKWAETAPVSARLGGHRSSFGQPRSNFGTVGATPVRFRQNWTNTGPVLATLAVQFRQNRADSGLDSAALGRNRSSSGNHGPTPLQFWETWAETGTLSVRFRSKSGQIWPKL